MKKTTLLLLLLLTGLTLLSQPKIDDYDKICFCSGKTPHSVLSFDNNWQIFRACREGISRKGLDSLHIACTDSQLKLMLVYKLIRKAGDKYYTSVPVFDEKQTARLRKFSKTLAIEIIPGIESDLDSLKSMLDSENYSGNRFSIVFSYLLDELVWSKFIERKILSRLELNSSNWPWTGTFWMVTPTRNNSYGTNGDYDSCCSLQFTHGPFTLEHPITDEDNALLHALLHNYCSSGRVTDEKLIGVFEKYGIVNHSGELTIPVIAENDRDRLFVLAGRIASSICTGFVENAVFAKVKQDFSIQDDQQAVIILYHEVMWDMITTLLEKKLVEEPAFIADPGKSQLSDISKLMFIVKDN